MINKLVNLLKLLILLLKLSLLGLIFYFIFEYLGLSSLINCVLLLVILYRHHQTYVGTIRNLQIIATGIQKELSETNKKLKRIQDKTDKLK